MKGKYDTKILVLGGRFSYVVTHPDTTFNLHGRKLDPTKGEKMEFVNVAKELGKELNLYHYYEKTIIGLCAQFIMYDKRHELIPSDKIMQIKDPDEKYKQIDDYAQKKAKSWLEGYEIFMASNPVNIIWEKFMKCARKLTKDKNLLVDDEMKEKICSDFARYPSKLEKCIGEYDLFFHKLVYHMRYREHMSIPEKIGPISSMQKNEIIADLPALPHISEIEALDDISNLWCDRAGGVKAKHLNELYG
ncbi:DNA polymerase family B-domain-containing protein [Rhizophagus clarus]|uniref:DNA polymerase family B-domain-containing protein n=1 Tax=Rhizophagus clarus TaxID=94130 RepID=A0A8H3M582_9GLOM|nr:DNA polymerase family B-domain-containing protein [Rhizophagus clarus]